MKNQRLKINSDGKAVDYLYVLPHLKHMIPTKPMPNPTPQMLNNDPVFDAIWEVVKHWDIGASEYYQGYCCGTGSHVTLIYEALIKILPK